MSYQPEHACGWLSYACPESRRYCMRNSFARDCQKLCKHLLWPASVPVVDASAGASCWPACCSGRTLKYTFCRLSSMRACRTLPVFTRSKNSEYTTYTGSTASALAGDMSSVLRKSARPFDDMTQVLTASPTTSEPMMCDVAEHTIEGTGANLLRDSCVAHPGHRCKSADQCHTQHEHEAPHQRPTSTK